MFSLTCRSVCICLTFTKLARSLVCHGFGRVFSPVQLPPNWVSRSVEQRCLRRTAEGGSRSQQQYSNVNQQKLLKPATTRSDKKQTKTLTNEPNKYQKVTYLVPQCH